MRNHDLSSYLILLCLCLGGCAGASNSPEACVAPKLAAVEAQYFSEAVDVCAEHTWELCPFRAELQEKYDAKRAAVVEACK
jgi:hypothetical protein